MKKYFLIELSKGDKKEVYKTVNAEKVLTCKMCNSQIFNNSEIANSIEMCIEVSKDWFGL